MSSSSVLSICWTSALVALREAAYFPLGPRTDVLCGLRADGNGARPLHGAALRSEQLARGHVALGRQLRARVPVTTWAELRPISTFSCRISDLRLGKSSKPEGTVPVCWAEIMAFAMSASLLPVAIL